MSSLATSTNPEAPYELLVSLLLRCPQTIEILPGDDPTWANTQNPGTDGGPEPSFSPFLFVEDNLGVPQKVLYKVYLHAVCILKSVRGRSCVPMRQTINVQSNHDPDDPLICALAGSSSVLMLANPSHQTALNLRKHLVRMNSIDPFTELRFTASLLSSQHCVKHAELWHHRRWLLSAIYGSHRLRDAMVSADFRASQTSPCLRFPSREALEQELALISRACEFYPRNYFAWMHRLICMRSLLLDYLVSADSLDFVSILHHEIATIKEWIERHVSDYSAAHHILTLAHAACQSGDSSLAGVVIEGNLVDHAISLVREYPTHESLWMYIRNAFSVSDSWQSQRSQQFIDDFVRPLANSQHSEASTRDGFVIMSQYARQFLGRNTASTSKVGIL